MQTPTGTEHTNLNFFKASWPFYCRLTLRSVASHLFTKSCSFCMGSGSPSRPQVKISRPSYTLIIRSAVFIKKQLWEECHRACIALKREKRSKRSQNMLCEIIVGGCWVFFVRPGIVRSNSPSFPSKFNWFNSCGVAGSSCYSEGGNEILSVCF